MASPRDSPASDVPSDNIFGTLSIRDKSLLKRNINKHHNNNFSAGYVPVHEEDLHKTGLRGRKLYVFWIVIAALCVLAFANLVLLLIMISVLRIGLGMESLEVISDQSLLKFYGRTDLGQIFKRDGFIQGFRGEPLVISGDESQLAIDILTPEREVGVRVMSLEENKILFQKVKSFQVKHPKTGKEIFSTTNPNFGLPKGVKNLHVDFATTSRVSSPVEDDLFLRSDSYIRFKGNEGTNIEGGSILLSADKYLFLKSVNGSIILNGTEGVSVDMTQMPQSESDDESDKPYVSDDSPDELYVSDDSSDESYVSQFKVCVCMPSGKLFRVAVHPDVSSHDACSRASIMPHVDPCKLL